MVVERHLGLDLTGYGIQAKHLLPRFRKLGHDVDQFAWYGLQGARIGGPEGMTIYPAFRDPWGSDVIGGHVRHAGADCVITLMDIWVLPADFRQRCGVPWISWHPVDHDHLSPVIQQRMKQSDYPVVYSKHGLAACEAAGLTCYYIPHGCDTRVFKPSTDRAAARKRLALPESAFICAMVAANKGYPCRKAFPEQLMAFKAFAESHDEALLYLHCFQREQDGLNLPALLSALDIPSERVRWVDQYQHVLGLPETYMADMYGAADVLLAATMGEGCGIPILEAQACGTPVITTNRTAMPEITINGIAVEPAQPFWVDFAIQGWQYIPSIPGILNALETIYSWDDATRKRASREGVAHIRQHYDWDVVVETGWAPFLAQVEAELVSPDAQKYVQLYESLAQRDAAMPRGPSDTWYNAHRFDVARAVLTTALQEELIALPSDAAALDVGCAEGGLIQALLASGEPFTGWQWRGLDISRARIERAREQVPLATFAQGMLEERDEGADGSVDLVLALELIEHVLDPHALLAAAWCILKPGGVLLLATPNDPNGVMVDGVEHVRGYGPETLTAAVQAAGFEMIATDSTVPGIYGADGLLRNPERLPAYRARAQRGVRGDWRWEDGSNLYVLARRPVEAG